MVLELVQDANEKRRLEILQRSDNASRTQYGQSFVFSNFVKEGKKRHVAERSGYSTNDASSKRNNSQTSMQDIQPAEKKDTKEIDGSQKHSQ